MRAPAKTFVRARRQRRELTLPEAYLWKALRGGALAGTRFRHQHPVGPFILDFYAPAARLAVEIDGAAHDVPAIAARDIGRTECLNKRGIRVLRFNAIDVLDTSRRNDVLETIAAALLDLRD